MSQPHSSRSPREESGEAPKWEILVALTLVFLVYLLSGAVKLPI